ncbi:MAG TPA: STAS domain-containing protein [Candidatus Glassbacteria bacterium]|nr:STAS domain-containing protein [Candidatus Glassbacteria bacterium]
MQVNVQVDDKGGVISVQGDVDLYSSPELRKAIARLAKKKIDPLVVDLADVEYMDSSGVATLVEGMQLTSKYEGNFRISCLSQGVREVFELARLDRVFIIFETREAALEGRR